MKMETKHLQSSQNSAKDKVSQSSVLSHKIVLDIMFPRKERYIYIENDTAACYNQILLTIVGLVTTRMGTPVEVVNFMKSFLE